MMKLIKNNIGEIIAFLSAIILLMFGFEISGLFKYSAIISDLRTEVYPLLEHLKNGFFLFDFSLGIGDSILGIVYYYLLSPLNILYFFIKNSNIAFITIIILKSGFSSLFCYKYLKYQIEKENRIYLVLFSLLYALSSYFISYNFVVEFLDAYLLLPLVLLGIDKIVKEKKYLLYVISLMLVVVTNYYFAYMICIFSFIYFNYRSFIECKEKEFVKNNFKFLLVSGLICLTMSFVFLPVVLEIGNYSRGEDGLFGGEPFQLLFNLRDIFEHYFVGNFETVDVINAMNFYLYTSVIVYPLIYFYYINNKISKREKIGSSVILLILLFSIGINYVNYMWHGFGVPIGFNGRFTFMFILFILMICFKSISYLKMFDLKHYIIIFSSVYIFVTLYCIIVFPRLIAFDLVSRFFVVYMFAVINSLLFKKREFNIKHYLIGLVILISSYMIGSLLLEFNYTNLLRLLGLYFCIFLITILNKNRNFKLKHFFLLFVLILVPIGIYGITSNIVLLDYCTFKVLGLLILYIILFRFIPKYKFLNIVLVLLLVFEISYNMYGYLYRFPYKDIWSTEYKDVIDYIENEDKSLFYRIENNGGGEIINNSILYNYYGVDYFMSTIKKDYINFFKNLGVKNYSTSDNSLLYDGSNHLISSLLGVKYYIETKKLDNKYYEKINSIGDYDIYKNNDSLSLGYMVHSDFKSLKYEGDGLEYLNNIYKTMTNTDYDILRKEEVTFLSEKEYKFKVTSSKDFYLLVDLRKYGCVYNIYLNDEKLEKYSDSNMYFIKNKYKKNEDVSIRIELEKEEMYNDILGVYVYYYNDKVYQENIDILKKNNMEVIRINKDGFEGEIEVNEDGILFLSCLYDNNIDIYVDGNKHDKVKLLDAFVGVSLDKGKHKITFKYNLDILYISIVPSIIGLILLIIFLRKFDYKFRLKK